MKIVYRADLIACFEEIRRVTHDWLNEVTEDASPRLISITFWQTYMVERMQIIARNEVPPCHVEFAQIEQNALNAQKTRAWSDLVKDSNNALNVLIAEVKRFSEEQIQSPNVYDTQVGPLWGEILANGFIHPMQQIADYYIQKGDSVRANQLNQRLTEINQWYADDTEKVAVALITPESLLARQAQVLIIDVRNPHEYQQGHLQGAVNIPFAQLAEQLDTLSTEQEVVMYCNMHHPGSSRGERAAALLASKGYLVTALDGGFPAWKTAKMPVEEGAS